MSTDDGDVVAEIPIGKGVDAVQFDPATRTAYSSCGDGTVTVVFEADAKLKMWKGSMLLTKRGARTCALDFSTHALCLCTAEYGPTPAATEAKPHPRPSIIPGSFEVSKCVPIANGPGGIH